MFGMKLEIIHGYPGSTGSLILALEQKEIDGLAGMPFASLRVNASHLMEQKRLVFLTQIGLKKHRELPDVPLLIDAASNEADRNVLKAVFAPLDVPQDRVAALRAAFATMVGDNAFLKDAETQKLDIELVRGEEIEKIVSEIYRLPPDLIERVKSVISLNN
jgi:tripartite-type tricarboxylate transporter receptor subunit TctC